MKAGAHSLKVPSLIEVISMCKREEFFEGVFVSNQDEYRLHIGAWSAQEATAYFREALLEDGVAASGILMIRNLKGQVLTKTEFAPSKQPSRRERRRPERVAH